MDAQPANSQPWANPQIRVAAIIILIVAVVAGLWFGGVFKSSKSGGGSTVHVTQIGPKFLTKPGLRAEAAKLGVPFYWAGPQRGFNYEFTRKTTGDYYVRYLPKGGPGAGAKGIKWTVIVTYPVIGGYNALKQQAKKVGAHTLKGPGGSIIYVDRSDPRSVYMGFKANPSYQIVVYSPRPTVAATIATSGQVAPVTG